MKAFLKTLAHAALGGALAGAGSIAASGPISAKTIVFPILGSALSSVISLFAQSPVASSK